MRTFPGRTGLAVVLALAAAGAVQAAGTARRAPAPPAGPSALPAQQGGPQPDGNDRVLVDARRALQQARTLGEAECTLRPAPCSMRVQATPETGFTLDVDGRGTHALRKSWHRTVECTDAPGAVPWLVRLPSPKPRRIYMRWNMRLGRSPTGGGLGAVNAFQITNAACGNAGRKVWLTLRDVPDEGSRGRLDFLWPGPAPVRPVLSSASRNVGPRGGAAFDPQQHVGETLTHVIYLQAESGEQANDGVVRVWVNGRLLIDESGLDLGADGFDRFQFPSTFRAPVQDQTEYFWDVVAWEPVA